MKNNLFIIGFGLILCLEVISILTGGEYRFISKPLVMTSLIIYFAMYSGRRLHKHIPLFVGLIFALIGDIFLLDSSEDSFKLGILAFMITHVCYVVAFLKQRSLGIHKHFGFILGFLLVPLIFNYLIWHHAGDLAIPICIYSLVISATVITARMRWKLSGYWYVLIGIIFFVISDLSIAIHKFMFDFYLADVWVMVTYAIAQLLIVLGYLMDQSFD